jgi:hypothetical protein
VDLVFIFSKRCHGSSQGRIGLAFKATTDSRHNLPAAANLIARDFAPAQPNTVRATNITYIATDEGWLYLAVMLDLFSRQVVGWAIGPRMTNALVINALRIVWFRRRPTAGLLHDRRFDTRQAAQWEAMDWLAFYNATRLHLTLGYVNPMQHQRNWLAATGEEVRLTVSVKGYVEQGQAKCAVLRVPLELQPAAAKGLAEAFFSEDRGPQADR